MKYKCLKNFRVDELETEESSEPIGVIKISEGSIWERRRISGDYDVMLDNIEDDTWLGLSYPELKESFKLISYKEETE